MRLLICLVLMFGFVAWDVTHNRGSYTHSWHHEIEKLIQSADLR
jgi:hypothetical protein